MKIKEKIDKLRQEQLAELLEKLREARYLVLKDAEAFREATTALEYVGQVIRGKMSCGLAAYREEIIGLAMLAQGTDEAAVGRLFEIVREARNQAVHDGAFARHLNTRLIDLILILEEAIMSKMNDFGDLMVRNPAVAEPWQLVWHVRNIMLANSFSNLPIRSTADGHKRWMILTDTAVMQLIRRTTVNDRRGRLAMPIEDAIKEGSIILEVATCVPPATKINDVAQNMNHLMVLVTENGEVSGWLLGIVTPFDLL